MSESFLQLRTIKNLGKQSYLALSLIAFLFVLPLTHGLPGARLMIYGVLTLVFITGPLAVARTRPTLLTTYILALLVLISGIASVVAGFAWTFQISVAVGFTFFVFLACLLFRELVFGVQQIEAETLWAAINVYILIGLAFAFLYTALALLGDDFFVGKFMDRPEQDRLGAFVYFSFVTLTTVGYGDISPNQPVVATLTYFEGLLGQLYLAIVIARLIGGYMVRPRQ